MFAEISHFYQPVTITDGKHINRIFMGSITSFDQKKFRISNAGFEYLTSIIEACILLYKDQH